MSTRPPRGRQKPRKEANTSQTPLKVVVRRLPPNLPENIFHTSIAAWHKFIDWSDYIVGKVSKSRTKSDTFSRAYIKFRKHADVIDFIKRYHGHRFVSADSKEFRACAEVAPFQQVPKPVSNSVKAKDNLCNTIEQDPDFLAFQESLKSTTPHKKEEIVVPSKITPLIEHLRAQKLKSEAKAKARKAKEALARGKQQEEKKKKETSQAQPDSSSAKPREKSAANGKGSNPKSKPGPIPTDPSASTKQSSKKLEKPSRTKTSDATNGSGSLKPTTTSTKIKAQEKKPAAIPVVSKPTSLAQQRLPNGGKAQATDTRPIEVRPSEQPKSSKPKKSKKKEGPKKPNGKETKQTPTKSAPVDISGPTPAEMAALPKGKI